MANQRLCLWWLVVSSTVAEEIQKQCYYVFSVGRGYISSRAFLA